MNGLPKVTIGIVTYNHEKFIQQALDSALSQDYPNLEIIVADDCSSDGTRNILIEYQKNHSDKLKIMFNEKNFGITGNSNVPLFASSGELYAFLAGDDVFLPGKIAAQVAEFVKDPEVVLCYHPVEIFDSETNKILTITNQRSNEDVSNVGELIMRGMAGAPSVMIKKSACPNGGFDARLPHVSDYLLFIEVALRGKIAKVNGVYARYRKHPQGASNRASDFHGESLYALDLLLEKHPERPELQEYCKIARARFMAGEAFRQLDVNLKSAFDLSRQAFKLCPNIFYYRMFCYLCFFLTKCEFVACLVVPIIQKAKFTIKRYLT